MVAVFLLPFDRLPRSSPALTAPWLAPLVNATPGTSSCVSSSSAAGTMKIPNPSLANTSAAAAASNHLLMKERDRKKREERDREREREKERDRERERERSERERERNEKLEREKERERRRHASRSPMNSRPTTNGPVKTESPINLKNTSMPNSMPPMPTFHPSLSQPPVPVTMSSSVLDGRSHLGLSMSRMYGQQYDPFRDVLRGMDPLRETMDREQRERDYMRFGAANPLLPGPPNLGPTLYHASPHSSSDRYRDFVGMAGLAQDRFRDGLGLPPHLAHMAGSLGLTLGTPPSGPLADRYRDGLGHPGMPGMAAPSLYPVASSSFQFAPGIGPPGLLGPGLGPPMGAGGLNSMPMLPPSLLAASTGKRTPPPPSSSSYPGPLNNPLASMSRAHMGMMPPSFSLPPYPMSSPSPMLNPHLLPQLGPSSLSNTRPPSTPPIGRSLMDLTSSHPPGLTPYNPMDYSRKDDPQSR